MILIWLFGLIPKTLGYQSLKFSLGSWSVAKITLIILASFVVDLCQPTKIAWLIVKQL
jgi:hypothetical protein